VLPTSRRSLSGVCVRIAPRLLVSPFPSPHPLAAARGQSLAQLALAWVLRQPAVTSALIGASRVEQLEANLATLDRLALADDELQAIEAVPAVPRSAA
jgi:aryl-alcohol dehydrogenase-like predicted oxidoreductase